MNIWRLLLPFLAISLSLFGSGCADVIAKARSFSLVGPLGDLSKLPIAPVGTPHVLPHSVEHPQEAMRSELVELPRQEGDISTDFFFLHRAHPSEVTAIDVRSEGTACFTGDMTGEVTYHRLLEDISSARLRTDKGKLTHVVSEVLLKGSRPILALSLSPDERFLAISQISTIVIFDLQERRIVHWLTRVDGRVTALAWDPRGELLAFGKANGEVYVWNLKEGKDAGEDSLLALESYLGGNSSVVRLLFHPTARSLFVAEAEGSVSIWRLLRTERELGLRDDQAVFDRIKRGRLRVVLANVPSGVQDLMISQNATSLFAAAVDGNVYQWKLRGLVPVSGIVAEKGATFSIAQLAVQTGGGTKHVVVTSGRGARLRFWCDAKGKVTEGNAAAIDSGPTAEEEILAEEATLLAKDVGLGSTSSGSTTANELLGETEKLILPPSSRPVSVASMASPQTEPLFSSTRLEEPAVIIRSGNRSGILWVVQKAGNLLAFDLNALLGSEFWPAKIAFCGE